MLNEITIRQAKPMDRDYKLSDGEGLYLFVTRAGHRSWRLKYRFAGKERRLILGTYPAVSLKEARERKSASRKLLDAGRDPSIEVKKQALQLATSRANTFETLARAWYAVRESRWTPIHARDVIKSLENEIFPWLGSLPVSEIDEPMVLMVLRKIERRGAIETAHRVRQRVSAVFVHAIAEGATSRDPAAIVGKALKPVPRKRKRPALLTLEKLHEMIRKTEWEHATPLTKLASRFLALTAQRPGMVRAMPWTEIENVDWCSEVLSPDPLWRIPAERMKLINELKQDEAFEHIVPLSGEAVAVLRTTYHLTGRGPLVFPGNRSSWRPMSENTLSYFYNRCGYQGRHVPHGWRSSFSTIMNEWAERNGTPADRQVIDLILAHVPHGISSSEGDYNRAAYMERRREIVQIWASMLLGPFAAPAKLLTYQSR